MKQYANDLIYVTRYGERYNVNYHGGVPYVTFERKTRVLYRDRGGIFIRVYGKNIYFI